MGLSPLPGQELHADIQASEQRVKVAKAGLSVAIQRVQSECAHRFVAEASYAESTWYSNSKSPFRVCLGCGLREEEWRSPYLQKLKDTPGRMVTHVSRDEGYRLVRTP